MNTLLDRICIRARDKEGKMGSFTLRELYDMGQAGDALKWLLQRLCGYEEGALISLESLQALVELLPPDSYVALKEPMV